MTRMVNDPDDFADEALAGFASVHPEHVLLLDGGVVRSTQAPPDHVAVVMGGGSGHFPAFAGWVGPGMAHGAACGNIFASPSEAQVARVARAADNGAGVLFLPINYAGDILHFSAAADLLRGEGVDVEMVAVTDDIASAPVEMRRERRGIAGSFLVAKIVGAAAEAGFPMARLTAVAEKANERTASFGVALSGCTLPGGAAPLFVVPHGRVAVGLGIHGEPGIAERDLGSADEVADLLLDGLLSELRPAPGAAVAALVNGLGSTTADELYVVLRRVSDRLAAAGVRLVAPVVGEMVSSIDMAGVSLSLTLLDDELEALWLNPADTACFRRGQGEPRPRRTLTPTHAEAIQHVSASRDSRASGSYVARMLGEVANVLADSEQHLGALDAVAGDGDHGIGMKRGSAAAAEAARQLADRAGAGAILRAAGAAWSDVGGGTSGALWGAGLTAAGAVVGDDRKPEPNEVVSAVRAFADAISDRGGAEVGQKTMVDAIAPFLRSLADEVAQEHDLAQSWRRAAGAARDGSDGTASIPSTKGRSKLHGDRSLGTPDPGAESFAMVVAAVSAVVDN